MGFNKAMKKVLILLFILLFIPFFTFGASNSDVVINEIAWMGSTNSANNEWMELFNNTNNIIDLSGWVLKSVDDPSISSGQAKLKINLKGVITAKGFYLLERTDDTSVPQITADLIYKGALSNVGQDLKLYDNLNNLIDEVNFPAKWPAGNNTTKQTMERADFTLWQTSKDPNGTPKAQNSPVIAENTGTQKSAIPINKTYTESLNAVYPGGVIINEILPAPEGSDEINEWIELYNTNNFTVDLSGWKLQDTKGTITTYIFPKNTVVLSNGYLVLKRPDTKIMLNNDEDSLNLVLPNEKITNSVSYINALKNQSYNNINSNWQWSTTKTPNSANIITAVAEPVKSAKKEIKSLPKTVKIDNHKIDNSIATASITDALDKNNANTLSPWFLFLTALSITIITAIIIFILKLKIFKKPNVRT